LLTMVEQDDRCGVWTERHRRCRCECRRWWLNGMRRLFRWDWLGLTALVFRRTIRLTHATFLEIQETQPACFNVLRWYLYHAPAPTSFGLGIKGFSVHTAAHDCQLAVLVVRVAGQIPAKPHDLVHCGQFVGRHDLTRSNSKLRKRPNPLGIGFVIRATGTRSPLHI
jgi:hypothetical protein